MLQVRHVPDEVHEVLRRRAAAAGMTLSAYVLRDLARWAAAPTLEEVLDEAATHATGDFSFDDVVQAVHDERRRG